MSGNSRRGIALPLYPASDDDVGTMNQKVGFDSCFTWLGYWPHGGKQRELGGFFEWN